jgi:hypothetical protein
MAFEILCLLQIEKKCLGTYETKDCLIVLIKFSKKEKTRLRFYAAQYGHSQYEKK